MQTKWIVFALAVIIVSASFGQIQQAIFPTIGQDLATRFFISLIFDYILSVALTAMLPIAIAFSILRYRLYDIDVIIRKTLVYTVVTGLLALVYYGSVVLLQSLFAGPGGERSPAAIVLSTLAIAALFNPLRRRVQAAVDRRFYRRKYDAGQTLASFAAISRDEVDIERLSTALIGAVEETVQPDGVGLWLRSAGK